MSEQKCLLFNWNVRGLNNKARRKVVKDLAQDYRCTIAALQETKMEVIQAADISETLGVRFSKQFAFLPAQGTRGGAVIAVDEDYYTILNWGYCVSTLVFNPNCDFAPTFSYFAFLPLLFKYKGAVYPYL